MLFRKEILRPGKVTKRDASGRVLLEHVVTPAQIRRHAASFEKLRAKGLHVPFVHEHPAGGDPRGLPTRDLSGVIGQVAGLEVTKDNRLIATLDVATAADAQKIRSGAVRFTSPEFRQVWVDKDGERHEHVITHVAATPLPVDKGQSDKFEPVETAAIALSEADEANGQGGFVEVPSRKTARKLRRATARQLADEILRLGEEKEDETDIDDGEDDSAAGEKAPEKNPDVIDTAAEGSRKQKLAAFIENLAHAGIMLPADLDLSDTDHFLDVALAAIKTKLAADAAHETDTTDDGDDEPLVKETPTVSQMSETEQKLLARANDLSRREVAQKLKFARLPKGLKDKLESRLSAVQFSEDGAEQVTFTLSEVVDLFQSAIPEVLTLSERDLVQHEPPAGFYSDGPGTAQTPEQAKALVDQQFDLIPSLRS